MTTAPSFRLRGARVIDPARGIDEVQDISVENGIVSDSPVAMRGHDLDAAGLVVAPAFFDLHTHLREPGGEESETIATAALAAAAGGYSTVCAMPNTMPPVDRVSRVRQLVKRARGAAVEIFPIASATLERRGERLTDLAALSREGVLAVSDDGSAINDEAVAHRVMERLASLGVPLMEHCEDEQLTRGTLVRPGSGAEHLGSRPRTAESETRIIRRDIALARQTRAHLHVTHVSTADGVELIRQAKREGVRITADVTPHHFAMHEEWVAGSRTFAWGTDEVPRGVPSDTNTRVNPPLGSRADCRALAAGVMDGTIDAIATDHAPHADRLKAVPFEDAPPGMIGLQTALSLLLEAVAARWLELPVALGAMTSRPAAVLGHERSLAPGRLANIVVFDPEERWRFTHEASKSKSSNSPLKGRILRGRVLLTVAHGHMAYDRMQRRT